MYLDDKYVAVYNYFSDCTIRHLETPVKGSVLTMTYTCIMSAYHH
jgi:hypothetical protein